MRDFPCGIEGVFTLRDALQHGWSPDAIERACRARRLTRLRTGAYCPAGTLHNSDLTGKLRLRSIAALLCTHHAVGRYACAAALHQLPLLHVPAQPCLSLMPDPLQKTSRITGACLHRDQLLAAEIVTLHTGLRTTNAGPGTNAGLRTTNIARTIIDLGCRYGLEAAVVAADAALASKRITPAELHCAIGAAGTRRGIAALRQLTTLLDPHTESPLESVSRLRLLLAGVPAPQTQVTLTSAGEFLGRVDFYWRAHGVVGEADGMGKYSTDPYALRREKLRQERLERAGLTVVRWGWHDLEDIPALVARLQAAFAKSSARRNRVC